MQAAVILLIPFLGTTLGAAMVFFMREEIGPRLEKLLLGFAAGVMTAASVWSLLIPAIDMAEQQTKLAWLPAVVGFLLGVLFLLVLDTIIPHLHLNSEEPEGMASGVSKKMMMFFAVALHNLPEGMAVGVTFAGAKMAGSGISLAAALALTVGIAIQNFPEGAIISLPLRGVGASRVKAFGFGALSGVVEPLGAIVTILLAEQIVPFMPYLLSFAAGAMFYVVVEELIPESQHGAHSNIGTVGAAIGFALMMILDVALG